MTDDIPKVCCIDRDSTIILSSSDPKSPLYYVTKIEHVILKPGVREAFEILRIHKVPVWLLTKQRCISKGIATREQVNDVNRYIENLLGFEFTGILVEEEKENKAELYPKIIEKYPNENNIYLFDDSWKELDIAAKLGIKIHDAGNLYRAICAAFNINS